VYDHLELLKPALKAKLEKDKKIAYLSKETSDVIYRRAGHARFQKSQLHDGVTPEFVAMLRKLEFPATCCAR